ncbi:hypothetical protein EJB05_05751, partial [Eragrostis curvula]
MAASAVEKLKNLWDSQVNDEEQWALNYVRTLNIPAPLLALFMNWCGALCLFESVVLGQVILLLLRGLRSGVS